MLNSVEQTSSRTEHSVRYLTQNQCQHGVASLVLTQLWFCLCNCESLAEQPDVASVRSQTFASLWFLLMGHEADDLISCLLPIRSFKLQL